MKSQLKATRVHKKVAAVTMTSAVSTSQLLLSNKRRRHLSLEIRLANPIVLVLLPKCLVLQVKLVATVESPLLLQFPRDLILARESSKAPATHLLKSRHDLLIPKVPLNSISNKNENALKRWKTTTGENSTVSDRNNPEPSAN